MNPVALKRWLAFFNLDQWIIRWYNLDAPQSMNAESRQSCQMMGFNPVDEG